jgi:hypothetical protein
LNFYKEGFTFEASNHKIFETLDLNDERYIFHYGKYISENVARTYIDWAQSKPFDIGQATSSALLVSNSETRGSAQSVFHAAATHNFCVCTPSKVPYTYLLQDDKYKWENSALRSLQVCKPSRWFYL